MQGLQVICIQDYSEASTVNSEIEVDSLIWTNMMISFRRVYKATGKFFQQIRVFCLDMIKVI